LSLRRNSGLQKSSIKEAIEADLMRLLRELFCVLILMFLGLGCQRQGSLSSSETVSAPLPRRVLGQREYAVHQRLTLVNDGPGEPEKQNLWVALIQSVQPYQKVLSMEITPEKYELVSDEYGNRYAEFDFSEHPAGKSITIEIDYQMVVNELAYDLSECEGGMPGEFTQPELHIESANPQIIALASTLAKDKSTVCQEVRAFYDYIGDELVYTDNGGNWGAQAALGPMGADCTEYTALLIALSRANGIPARYFTGLLYLDKDTNAAVKIEHAWPDVYLPAAGWVALDPTLGRTPVKRDAYFAHYTPDHLIVTMGVNPSVLRGSSYWTHLYWPGNSTQIEVSGEWEIDLSEDQGPD
jgi:transglutaminase-like putative cysteine protease